MELRCLVKILNKEYPVVINKKKVTRISVRFDGIEFRVTSPKYYMKTYILSVCKPVFEKFISKQKTELHDKNGNLKGLFIFGEYHDLDDGFIDILGHQILFVNLDDFYKKIKKIIYPVFEKLFREVEEETHSEIHHDFKIVKVRGYYGQNNITTHLIKINVNLVHYHYDVIKSVMYHELAHDFVRAHNKEFYAKLKSFDENYKLYDKIIKTKDFKATLL